MCFFSHIFINLVNGFVIYFYDLSVLESNLSHAFMFSSHASMI